MKRAAASPTAGWTLTELLVVLAIIAALSALTMPMAGMVRARYWQAACQQNLRQIGDAIQMYASDHNGSLPVMAALRASRQEEGSAIDNSLADYLRDERVFRCPADTKKRLWETSGTSYHWNSALNGQNINALQFMGGVDASRIPFVGDKEGFHEGCPEKVNILYADGRSTNKLRFR